METDPIEVTEVEDVKKAPVTVGMLIGIVGGTVFAVGVVVSVMLWISAIGTNAQNGIIANAQKIETINVKLDAAAVQRDLTMRNRDLQIDSLKSEVDRNTKRQDTMDATLTELSKKLERVLVVTESIDKRLDHDGKP